MTNLLFYAAPPDYTAALRCADRALELDPGNAHAWSGRGSALNNLGRYDEALSCYEQAIALLPGYSHPWYCRACTYALTGQTELALEMVEKTLALDPAQRGLLGNEPDLRSLRTDPRFQALVAGGKEVLPGSGQ